MIDSIWKTRLPSAGNLMRDSVLVIISLVQADNRGNSLRLAILKVNFLISDRSVHEFTTPKAQLRCMTSLGREHAVM